MTAPIASPPASPAETVTPAPPADTAARFTWPRLRAAEWVGIGILAVVAAFILIVPLLPGSDPYA